MRCMSKVITALCLENLDIYFKQIIQHIKNIPFFCYGEWGLGGVENPQNVAHLTSS